MKKCKFNVGDEVVLNQNYDKFEVGTRAKVIKTDDNLVFCKTWDGKRLDCFDYRLNLVLKPVDPTSKLKIGDRVVLNRDLGKCRKGATGTVKSFGDYNATLKAHMVYVTLDDKSTIGTYENRFDLVSETPKCKFKLGDRVKANETSNKRYGITNLRNKFTGEVVGVRTDDVVDIKDDSDNYVWRNLESDCFDLIESTPEIHITVKGNATIAVYKNGTETKTAGAKCSPEDTFDFGIGAKLALERLDVLPTDEPKKEEPEYYNGKVVCTMSTTPGFTVGKVYTFVDGTVRDDDGDLRYNARYLRVKHPSEIINLWNFIPLVE